MHTIATHHPNEVFNGLLKKIKDNKNGSQPVALHAIARLECLHEVCRNLVEAGTKDFSYPNVSLHCAHVGGPTIEDGTIYKPRHRELIRAWATLVGGTRAKSSASSETAKIDKGEPSTVITPHPNKTLEELVKKTIAHRNLNEPAIQKAIRRLKILHDVCLKSFKAGSQDFSMRTLGAICGPLGGPTFDDRSIYRSPNRTLINAWAEFANGYTKTPKQLLRAQDRKETIDYIDAYFKRTGRLPTFEMIQKEGMTIFVGPGRSKSAQDNRVTSSLALWKQAHLQQLPEQVTRICDDLFDQTQSIPDVATVRAILTERNFKVETTLLNQAVKGWQKFRFAVELFNFAATNDESGFLWLALHPELAEWRPMVVGYLNAVTPCRTHVNLGLQAFFADYLLQQSSRISPKAFLSATYTPPPIADVYLKKVAPNEAQKRWRTVCGFIEHVLDHGKGFATVDSHGHTVRMSQYCNTLPPLMKKSTAELAKNNAKRRIYPGTLQDPDLLYLTRLNPQLEQWRIYAMGWLASIKANVGAAQTTIREFFVDYIVAQRLPSDPSVLLSTEWLRDNKLPSYRDTALSTTGSKHARPHFAKAVDFIDYVLQTHYSAEDDYGRRVVSGDFHNFLIDQEHNIPRNGSQNTHSNKDVLPSRYIRYLRDLLCPSGAKHFRDLIWAHDAVPLGDWFEVSPKMIDEKDPDCVWRVRTIFGQGTRRQEHKSKRIYEMWYPGRTVAMMLKLELPLRTYQVRMLDSGELDTWHYEGSTVEQNSRGEWIYLAGKFIKNESLSDVPVRKIERHAGVFRRMPDSLSGKVFAGLYINTNKTQDRDKEQWERGYVVPWQHGKVLYWCERLREWQRKYNPIDGPVPCTLLPEKLLGKKSDVQKQQMGSMCFLFRDPVATQGENAWPLANGKLVVLWLKMLERLELICAEKSHTAIDGSPLRFIAANMVPPDSALYSLHSLRVSLITHLATEGGVEMHILSECIAGHARILMTLYYKKSGVVYVSEAMEAASERLRDETVEQQNWLRWMKDASLKQLEVNSAAVDISVAHAVKDAFSQGGAALLRTNLGLCAKGGMSCDTGGRFIDEETGTVSYGPTPGYPQQKNCVRCRWFLTGPAFLPALVHHWNLLHFNLGDSGHRYLETSTEIAELEAAMLSSQQLNTTFEHQARLENLRHALSVIYDGNEKLAEDSLATMKLIVRCKHIVDAATDADSEVVLVAVGGMDEVTLSVRECSELEQVLTVAIGSTIYVDDDAQKAVFKAANAFDRMLALNGKDPLFFKLSEHELPIVVSHMARLLRAYAGSISEAVPFIEGAERLSALGLYGDTDEIVRLASAGTPMQLGRSDRNKATTRPKDHRVIPLRVLSETGTESR